MSLLDSNKLHASEIVGNVVVGGNSGIIYQSFGGGPPPAPPTVNWAALPARGAPFEYFNLLSWRCRLAPELIGRDAETATLADWARTGSPVRIRFLVGPGGAGKTRLAAEVVEALRKEKWHAGFTPLEQAVTLPLASGGLFLLMDYPEAWREQVRSLLREAAHQGTPAAPIRILLLSRRPLSEWEDDIIQSGAAHLCDAQEIRIGQLEPDLAITLFKTVAGRLAQHRQQTTPHFDDTAITRWLATNSVLYSLPLLITAGAIHFVDFHDATLDLRGVDIIRALVERERAQLDRVGRSVGWGDRAASRLIGLAALRDGLDEAALRRLAKPELEIGLPEPARVVDAVHRYLRWQEGKGLSAPGPDVVAAELLWQVLAEGGDRSREWVWETLAEPGAVQVELLDRRIHDTVALHGPAEKLLVRTLVDAVTGREARAAAWRTMLDSGLTSFRLSAVGTAVAQALLEGPDLSEEDRAAILNNLSLQLSNAGDGPGALAAIREAVNLYRRLAQENPARFAPELATTLNNLSNRLSDAGDGSSALAAIREAVEIRRRLAQENPARFAPDLASSLNNLSLGLSDAGDGPGALAAIREAVEIHRRLAQENPGFAPNLASSLNNLSNHLSDAGDGAGALAASREAVEIRRRLAQENPARFAPDLALSLSNLSLRPSDATDGPGALAAIREAVDRYRSLAQENPARFAPDLAMSLNNLSLRLSDAGDGPSAFAAIHEAVELYRRLAQENPARFTPNLAMSLNNLSRLSDADDRPGALAAIREAVKLYRWLAQENPAHLASYLATSLNNLSLLLSDAGDGPGALVAIREAVEIRRRLAHENPARFTRELERSLRVLAILQAEQEKPAK